MPKFRKKPVIVEALRVPEDVPAEGELLALHNFLRSADWHEDPDGNIIVNTLEGAMRACAGDWIIKGVAGEFYPCKADIFARTYEQVADHAVS